MGRGNGYLIDSSKKDMELRVVSISWISALPKKIKNKKINGTKKKKINEEKKNKIEKIKMKKIEKEKKMRKLLGQGNGHKYGNQSYENIPMTITSMSLLRFRGSNNDA